MLDAVLIFGSVASAIAILFVCLFVHFGARWNSDL